MAALTDGALTKVSGGEFVDEGVAKQKLVDAVADVDYQTVPAEGPFVDGDKTKLVGIEAGATADQTGAEIKALYEAEANTNAYTDAEKTKLAGIEAGATADQTGAEIKALYEAELNTNAYTDAEKTKLAGIETGADVTDTANVTAAGALMDSEVDQDIKTLVLPANTTISAFGASLTDDADAPAARGTLGLVIGTDVQAFNALLADIAGTTFAQGDVIYHNGTNLVKLSPGTSGQFLQTQGAAANPQWATPSGSGDVVGPASATDSNVAMFDGITGKLIKDSGLTLSGSNTGDEPDATTTTKGIVELATDGENAANVVVQGNDSRLVHKMEIGIAASDETTALTTGTAKATFRVPRAMTVTAVRASVTTAPTGANLVVDINEGGVSILSTPISIDAGEKTSTTAATPPVISDSALADDAEITIDIDQIGSTVAGAGLKIWIIGVEA